MTAGPEFCLPSALPVFCTCGQALRAKTHHLFTRSVGASVTSRLELEPCEKCLRDKFSEGYKKGRASQS